MKARPRCLSRCPPGFEYSFHTRSNQPLFVRPFRLAATSSARCDGAAKPGHTHTRRSLRRDAKKDGETLANGRPSTPYAARGGSPKRAAKKQNRANKKKSMQNLMLSSTRREKARRFWPRSRRDVTKKCITDINLSLTDTAGHQNLTIRRPPAAICPSPSPRRPSHTPPHRACPLRSAVSKPMRRDQPKLGGPALDCALPVHSGPARQPSKHHPYHPAFASLSLLTSKPQAAAAEPATRRAPHPAG